MYISSIRFSLWCDFIERSFLEEDFVSLISDEVINGATSNPSIFNSAFSKSLAYKQDIEKLSSLEPKQAYESLALEDIQSAAKKLLPLYEKDNDGFVSIEVDPFLADDADATIEEGRRLFKALNMPNVMIKIPATKAGYEAMKTLMSDGINVNATLIFSPNQAKECLMAFEEGLKLYRHTYSSKKEPKAVISVFVSRFDRKLDSLLHKKGIQTAKVGILNAIKIYKLIESKDNENIRCLFASTGVKGDDLKSDYYIEQLLFPNAINTAPLDTILAFISNDKTQMQELPSDNEIESFFKELADAGVDMEKIYEELMDEGMEAFKIAFKQMLDILK
ncbi:MAG: transaldolase [Campylobacteraceae bacterium]|nr:transaldolase [Campylobacteraceae bacterium]